MFFFPQRYYRKTSCDVNCFVVTFFSVVFLQPFPRNPLACCLWPTFYRQSNAWPDGLRFTSNSPPYGANPSSNARGMPGGRWTFLDLTDTLTSLSLPCPGVVRTVAGGGKAHEGGKTDCVDDSAPRMDGVGTDARFNYPWGIEFDSADNVLYVADCVSRYLTSISNTYLKWLWIYGNDILQLRIIKECRCKWSSQLWGWTQDLCDTVAVLYQLR